MNILICYMHESELRMQSYEAMNMSIWIRVSREKVNPRRYFQIWIQCTETEVRRNLRRRRAGRRRELTGGSDLAAGRRVAVR